MASTNGEEIKRLDLRVDSVESGLLSLTKSINRNTVEILQRVTSIERTLELRTEYVDKRLGEYDRILRELTELQHQAKGIGNGARIAVWIIGAVEAWHVATGFLTGKK